MRKTYIPPGKPTRRLLCPKMLRAAMKASGVSQAALGRAIGVSQPAIFYLLQQPSDPEVSIAVKIAGALEVDLSALLTEAPGAPGDLPLSRALEIAKLFDLGDFGIALQIVADAK